ncbi:MAG: toxin HicA [Anaerolineae bacterium]|nr:toxin HicA [Anaerolineae bacterium]
MARVEEIVANMRQNPKGIRYRDLCKVCDFYFGNARQKGSSHRIYRTPWPGDPRVNIQNAGGMAKAYQVRQVLRAIDRLETYGDARE